MCEVQAQVLVLLTVFWIINFLKRSASLTDLCLESNGTVSNLCHFHVFEYVEMHFSYQQITQYGLINTWEECPIFYFSKVVLFPNSHSKILLSYLPLLNHRIQSVPLCFLRSHEWLDDVVNKTRNLSLLVMLFQQYLLWSGLEWYVMLVEQLLVFLQLLD